jgi:hypothetical protein
MRLKADIESKRLEAFKLMKAAEKNEDTSMQNYYYGVFVALQWVQDKRNEETDLL